MKLWNNTYTKNELMRYVGDASQAFGIRRAVLDDGPGRGMRVIDVNTGGGLEFTVLPDRGMDIAWCRYKGLPMGFISKTGAVHPALCGYGGNQFLRGFTAGLLTTCGYTHMGSACTDEGQALGLHGRATQLPAAELNTEHRWEGDSCALRVIGFMREAAVFDENIKLSREISAQAGGSTIAIADTVENCGFERQPLMLLYHVNFGHPLVGPATRFVANAQGMRPRDAEAEKGADSFAAFHAPRHGYAEQVFYHSLTQDADGRVAAGLHNPDLGVAANLRFYKSELPYFIQWKQLGEGDYTCGLEPATWYPEGRGEARRRGELTFIEPGETKRFRLEIEFAELNG